MRLARILSGRPNPAKDVCPVSDGLEMIRPYAQPVSAQVVEHEAFGHLADSLDVGRLMRPHVGVAELDPPVTSITYWADPSVARGAVSAILDDIAIEIEREPSIMALDKLPERRGLSLAAAFAFAAHAARSASWVGEGAISRTCT
jgi:hypothetical protein